MKYFVLFCFSSLICWAACSAPKKIEYDFPPAMAENIRSEYQKLCEQGRVLYEQHCSGCHTTKIKGKKVIPDFTDQQMVGYGIRISNKRHEESMPDSVISEEELGMISMFFAYKRKNK